MNKQPNILFIIADQHNAKVFGHKGHPHVKTPNLDQFASEGVRFENAITQAPICMPSRTSIFSGQYPHNHGYYGNEGPHPGGLPSLFGFFRQANYRVGAMGIVHLPDRWAYDDCDVVHNLRGVDAGGAQGYAEYLAERGLENEITSDTVDGRVSNLDHEDSLEGWTVRNAINFMEQSIESGQPFFLNVNFLKPHSPYFPSRQFWDMYDPEQLTFPPNMDYDMSLKAPNLQKQVAYFRSGQWTKYEPRTFEAGRLRKLRGYLGCVSEVDYSMGQLLAWLRDNNLEQDTIVVYTSDHGDYACEHSLMEKAPGICSDAITRVPSIWRWPGHFKAGHVAKEIIENVDITPTLCALAGLGTKETCDGVDISHLLQGQSGEVHRVGVTEFAWSKSVRKGNYRYVYYPREMFPAEYPDGNFGELYDLEADPWEMRNLYFEPEYASVVNDMRLELMNWLVTTTRPRTVHALPTYTSRQTITRNGHTVNLDGKVHPNRLRQLKMRNYL